MRALEKREFKTLSKKAGIKSRRTTTIWTKDNQKIVINGFKFPNQITREVKEVRSFIYEWGSGNGIEVSYPYFIGNDGTILCGN